MVLFGGAGALIADDFCAEDAVDDFAAAEDFAAAVFAAPRPILLLAADLTVEEDFVESSVPFEDSGRASFERVGCLSPVGAYE